MTRRRDAPHFFAAGPFFPERAARVGVVGVVGVHLGGGERSPGRFINIPPTLADGYRVLFPLPLLCPSTTTTAVDFAGPHTSGSR